MNTNDKGAVALTKTIADLTVKGYNVFHPISEHSRIDLIAEKDGQCFKLQVKYCGDDVISVRNYSITANTKGIKNTKYQEHEIDYYAIYSSVLDKVIYPAFNFGGKYIRITPGENGQQFLWYEDFLSFTDTCDKRNIESKFKGIGKPELRKVDRPSKDELATMIEEKPISEIAKSYGISDKAVAKWCALYDIKTKPRGYWATKRY